MPAKPIIHPQENVARGIVYVLPAMLVVIIATQIFHELHVIASLSIFLYCIVAMKLYVKGAGGMPIKGRWWFIGLIAVAIVLSFFTLVIAHLAHDYDLLALSHHFTISKLEFIKINIFYTKVLSYEKGNFFLLVLFGLLGAYGTIRSIFVTHKLHKSSHNTPPAASESQLIK